MTTTCLNILPSLTYEWLAVGGNTIFCLRIGIGHNCGIFSKNSKTENIHHSHHFHSAHLVAEFPACRNTKDIGSCIFCSLFLASRPPTHNYHERKICIRSTQSTQKAMNSIRDTFSVEFLGKFTFSISRSFNLIQS